MDLIESADLGLSALLSARPSAGDVGLCDCIDLGLPPSSRARSRRRCAHALRSLSLDRGGVRIAAALFGNHPHAPLTARRLAYRAAQLRPFK